jgi:large subunit ribosomal protein L29
MAAKLKIKEVRDLALDELKAKVGDLRKELFDLRNMHIAGKLENKLQIRMVRRNMARFLTIIREKENKQKK